MSRTGLCGVARVRMTWMLAGLTVGLSRRLLATRPPSEWPISRTEVGGVDA